MWSTSGSLWTGQGKEQARPHLLAPLRWRNEGLKELWLFGGFKKHLKAKCGVSCLDGIGCSTSCPIGEDFWLPTTGLLDP